MAGGTCINPPRDVKSVDCGEWEDDLNSSEKLFDVKESPPL